MIVFIITHTGTSASVRCFDCGDWRVVVTLKVLGFVVLEVIESTRLSEVLPCKILCEVLRYSPLRVVYLR